MRLALCETVKQADLEVQETVNVESDEVELVNEIAGKDSSFCAYRKVVGPEKEDIQCTGKE